MGTLKEIRIEWRGERRADRRNSRTTISRFPGGLLGS
jgi:hypothetical protein